jgi:catechol 2,3-dioxygenase-like lactoylglutathione lyase family enzyme
MKFRVARHTTNLTPIIDFYRDVLGLTLLGEFEDHAGYNGVFLGITGADWHLEFTVSADAPYHQADDDDFLVFYQQSETEYQALKQKFEEREIKPVRAKNPYWNTNGTIYKDPDGYGVIIAVRQ